MDKFLKGDLFTKNIDDFEASVNTCMPPKNICFQHNTKYSCKEYLNEIIKVLKTSVSWNSFEGKIPGNTLNKKHIEWSKKGVYEHFYNHVLNKHLEKVPKKTEEFKILSIDSTFANDKNGSKDSGKNRYYGAKRKGKGIKTTTIVTVSGIPIAADVANGKHHDAHLFNNVIDNMKVNTHPKKYADNNRYKQYLTGDKAYDSKKIREILSKKGYIPIIPFNKRNSKTSIPKTLSDKHKKILKKRVIVEHYFSWLKKYRRVESLFEKNIKNYEGFLFLAMSLIICRKTILLQKNQKMS